MLIRSDEYDQAVRVYCFRPAIGKLCASLCLCDENHAGCLKKEVFEVVQSVYSADQRSRVRPE